ncbi:MAG TPA: hypothetical protein VFT13_02175 [Candidatus Krumholzibacteria bacterium]|nr:hypothetical protein [Candidatus Krumholzibacteria bacterium]
MKPLGWISLIMSLAFVWGLAGWCYYKILTVKHHDTVDRLD